MWWLPRTPRSVQPSSSKSLMICLLFTVVIITTSSMFVKSIAVGPRSNGLPDILRQLSAIAPAPCPVCPAEARKAPFGSGRRGYDLGTAKTRSIPFCFASIGIVRWRFGMVGNGLIGNGGMSVSVWIVDWW